MRGVMISDAVAESLIMEIKLLGVAHKGAQSRGPRLDAASSSTTCAARQFHSSESHVVHAIRIHLKAVKLRQPRLVLELGLDLLLVTIHLLHKVLQSIAARVTMGNREQCPNNDGVCAIREVLECMSNTKLIRSHEHCGYKPYRKPVICGCFSYIGRRSRP